MNNYLVMAGLLIIAAAVISFNIDDATGYAGNMQDSTSTANAGWRVGAGLEVYNGDIYTLSTKERQVIVFNPIGEIVLRFGGFGEEQGKFRSPVDIALDHDGNIYVSDRGRREILKFDNQGNFIKSFGGSGDEQGKFKDPSGLAIEADKVYVLDVKARKINMFDLDGDYQGEIELPRKES